MLGAVIKESDTKVEHARARVKRLLLKEAPSAKIEQAQADLDAAIEREAQGRRRANQRVELQREAEREKNSAEVKRLLERENAAELLIQARAPALSMVFEGIKITVQLGQRDVVDRQTAEEAVRVVVRRVTTWWQHVTVAAARTVARGGVAVWPHVSLFSQLEDELRIAIKRGLVKLEQVNKENNK
jgi:hypothetical protein